MEQTEKNKSEMEHEEGSSGPVIGSVIIIIIIIIGGLYFWGNIVDKSSTEGMSPEEILSEEDGVLNELQKQSSSDEIEAIEEDLNNSDLNNLDSELNDIEEELENI